MKSFRFLITTISLFIFSSLTNLTYAHCDGLDGPVVQAAIKSLESNNVNLVLIWVNKEDENTVKEAFVKTISVRKINQEAKELADMYFFETLVRIHRAGEGKPYTGLKAAGRDLIPVIPAADKSIEMKSLIPLKNIFSTKTLLTAEIQYLFKDVIKYKNYNINDIEAGRKYVRAYVEFLHKVEAQYELL